MVFRTGAVRFVASWRVGMRTAWRVAYQRPLQSVLVATMLALPVFAGSAALSGWSSLSVSPEQEATWRLGQADVRVDGVPRDALAESLPAGSRLVPQTVAQTVVTGPDGRRVVEYHAADVTDPLLAGVYRIADGRAPTGPDGVAVTPRLAEELDTGNGRVVTAGVPARAVTVVGVVQTPEDRRREALVAPPEHPMSAGGRQGMLVGLPDDGPGWHPTELDVPGLSYMLRSGIGPSAAERAVAAAGVTVVVGFVAAQVCLLAAAAFAVGARRRRRELGLMAAVGATDRQLARQVLAQGLLFGVVGGAVGMVGGVATWRLGQGVAQRFVAHEMSAVDVAGWQFAGVAAVAVGVGLLAAWAPARSVARAPVLATLTRREVAVGRRGRRLATVGLVLAALGATITVWAVRPAHADATVAAAGAGLLLCGTAALAPALIGVAGRVAGRTSLALRLALRHAARHRLRTGAAAAAVCAAMAGSVGVTSYVAADTRTGAAAAPVLPEDLVALPAAGAERLAAADVEAVADALPSRDVVQLRMLPARPLTVSAGGGDPAAPPQPTSPVVAVGGAEVVQAVTGVPVPQRVAHALARGQAVTFHPQHLDAQQVHLARKDREPAADAPDAGTQDARVELPAVLARAPAHYRSRMLPSVVVPEETARDAGFTAQPGGLLVDTTRAPTADELAAAQDTVLGTQVRDDGSAPSDPVPLAVGEAASAPPSHAGPVAWVLAVVSALVTVAASGVAVALATSEMRGDLGILAATGAGPQLQRRVAAAQAGLVVGVGGLLGVLGGVAPAAALVALREQLTWHLPWGALALLLVAAPAAAVAGTVAFTRPPPATPGRLG